MKKSFRRIGFALLVMFLLLGCGSCGNKTMKDGVYTSSADGHNGPVTVQMTIKEGKIADVAVVDNSETASIAAAAIERIPAAIVEHQSLAIDAISGATKVSEAILNAAAQDVEKAGGSAEALKAVQVKTDAAKTESYDCDVVVIGAGGAGSAAAVTAAEGGEKVILVEKAAQPGGTSILASGIFATDSRLQKEAGVVCRTGDVYKVWQDYTSWLNDPSLTWRFFKQSASTVDWLEDHGFAFKLIPNVQKSHEGGFETYHHYKEDAKRLDYIKSLLSYLDTYDGEVMYETPAKKILMKDGHVAGIEAQKADGTKVIINANAVVIASGGFGANREMLDQATGGVAQSLLNSGTQTGDGIKMARAVGAGGENREFSQYHGVDMPFDVINAAGAIDDKGARGGIEAVNHLANYPGALWVNAQGMRFASEALAYDSALVANATAAAGGNYYVIIDSTSLAALESGGTSALGITESPERLAGQELTPIHEPWTGLSEQFGTAFTLGGAFKGDTLEDLATAIGINPATFAKSVAAYNQVCAAKNDEQFEKDPMYLVPITKGPFYACKGQTVTLGGLGGISTDSRLNVTDKAGKPISGLYAAGNVVNAIYNNVYPLIEGVTAAWAYNSGRIAGQSVLEDFAN
ncbi:FAD-dependent oxidoreductase [Sediminispirochaeta bajacaliforniensis]|uniref:FAD-dependent oxidoreductase n=1 Tax=Sediminispirochaeta bajacaliforniensis TaxID=148 RepID=UPI000379B504